MIDQQHLRKNINMILFQATDEERAKGERWYANAGFIASGMGAEYGYTKAQACGIIAALSPRTEWHQNLLIAERFMRGEECIRQTGNNLEKAARIAEESEPEVIAAILFGRGGRKVEAFYYNLTGDHTYVTIDRHAFDLALQSDEWKTLTPSRHSALVMAYTAVAEANHLQVCQVQAITWLTWRRMKGYTNKEASWHVE